MVQWRFSAGNPALQSCGAARDGRIEIEGSEGTALFGPYLELPAGKVTARVRLAGEARGQVWADIAADEGRRVFAEHAVTLDGSDGAIELTADLAETVQDVEVRVQLRGDSRFAIAGLEIDLEQASPPAPDPARPVGFESRKTYAEKLESGFIQRYLSGATVIELGYKGYIGGTVPIVPQAIGIDLGYPGYDGSTLPFADDSVDAIYSSHCFEHIPDYITVLRDWYRLLKTGGHIVMVVPHQYLFEKRRHLPSPSNPDHRRYYTPESLCREIAEAFEENSYRIRHLTENDRGFNYEGLPEGPSYGLYEIEVVIEKIEKPYWNLVDNSVRAYPPAEFLTHLPRADPWSIDLDLSIARECQVWGPYIRLGRADYEAEFFLEGDAGATGPLEQEITLDVACMGERIAHVTLAGEAGRRLLQGGRIAMPFAAAGDDRHWEFRIYPGAEPSAERVRFKGVVIHYAKRPR